MYLAPLNYIAEKTSAIPLLHQRKRGDKWVDVENSQVLATLSNPNQYETETGLRQSFIINYLLFGNAYINRVVPIGSRKARQLYIPPSDKVTIKLNEQFKDPRLSEVVNYVIQVKDKELIIEPENIYHAKQAGGDWGLKGRSKLMSAILTSKSLRANYEARVRIYEARGAMGILSPRMKT